MNNINPMSALIINQIIRKKPRSVKDISKILNLSDNAMYQRICRYNKRTSYGKKEKILLRFLLNIDDDVLKFFLDDNNFNVLKCKNDNKSK